jgi:DNA-binding protein HU-beta
MRKHAVSVPRTIEKRVPKNKTMFLTTMADLSHFSKAEVAEFMTMLRGYLLDELNDSRGGPGAVMIPYLDIKISVVERPATQARQGINPHTGEKIMIAAKPAHRVVKLRATKALKDEIL